MKTYFTAFVVVMVVLSLTHDSQEFTAGAGTTVGRRSFEKVKRFNETFKGNFINETSKFKFDDMFCM